jgi:vacuolar-type H+-ATPase subunit D/Vma8
VLHLLTSATAGASVSAAAAAAAAVLQGMYTQMEEKLEVRAGCEFIAARATLIQMLQEEEQQQQQQQLSEETWLDRCVAGDRELLDTLLGLWGSLKPLRRLKFMWELLKTLVCGVSAGALGAVEDVVWGLA